MRIFGSLTNRLMEAAKQPEPQVGMGATVTSWSDRTAGTVIHVALPWKRGPVLVVQEDKATRTDKNGMSDSQTYAYEPDHEGEQTFFRLDRDGSYREVDRDTGRWVGKRGDGRGLLLGHRNKHHDFSF